MKFTRHIFLMTIFLGLTTACGFEPLHGSRGYNESRAIYNDIYIDNIRDRSGQILRNDLIDRFYTQGRPTAPEYILRVSDIEETTSNLDLTATADTTRAQLRMDTKMRLEKKDTGELLLERELTSISSYNVLQSQFTTRVSEENVRENILKDLARQIDVQLALYFKRK